MHIKKFRGETLEEALKEVKAVFGADAVIISTKKCAGLAEVTAAIEFNADEIELNLGSSDEFREGISDIKEELRQLRSLFHFLAADTAKKDIVDMGSTAFRAYEDLVKRGVNVKLTRRLVKMAAVATSDGPEDLKQRCFRLLMDRTGVYNPLAAKGGTKMLAFVGPTGVGKTTTIAKLAGGLKRKYDAKVVLISLGGSGLELQHSLKECGTITDFQMSTPSGTEEFNRSLWEAKDKDVILIDTPGLNPRDHDAIETLEPLFSSGLPIKVGLVLSVTSNAESQYEACKGFGKLPLDCVTFTKIDEASRFGSILNTAALLNKPVSYLCSGQKIPYDIGVATGEAIEGLVLNGREQRTC